MNIKKTNRIGLEFAKIGFIGASKAFADLKVESDLKETQSSVGTMPIDSRLFKHNPKSKIIRVSKGVMDACKMIDIESIKENIDQANLNIQSMFILLDNDKSGLIRVERLGSDFSFLFVGNLGKYLTHEFTYNAYSFIARSFYIDKENESNYSDYLATRGASVVNYEKSVFVVQLLTYLIFGEITEKNLPPNAKADIGGARFLNNSKLNVTFCDTLWKQRINIDGFKVRGHFRLQPHGEKSKKRKLIWIEEFEKQGYNRKATVELQKPKTD